MAGQDKDVVANLCFDRPLVIRCQPVPVILKHANVTVVICDSKATLKPGPADVKFFFPFLFNSFSKQKKTKGSNFVCVSMVVFLCLWYH